ncbi:MULTISPECIES: MATE family efflux transporter [Eubacteriales]|jgi:putative MATE family efflux protein|uniref:MATE family efflux transporter n=1 Tax=Eubacteriales TaxID=186802 RepID=UPI000E3F42CB|nr:MULTISPECIES: MATE family efflux transporter [Eubacteriales]RGE02121.1 MATE family efflux transporter [Clostridiaceae bacterium AF02-42]RGE06271.1 MATE family efflux transporter [Clostridium sp. AM34-11AC]RGE14132.1 MATE family efflux transporter [Desulfotomaculum sp. OF05-3]
MNNRLFSRNDLVRLIIPLIVDQFLQVAVGLSDSIMVARVGEAAVSGVSLVDTVMLLIINIFTALATGGAVIAGQYLGRKDPKTGCEATAQLFNFTFLFSIFIMILGYLGQNVILYHVFGKIEPEVMKDSRTYLLIVLSSIPMIAMYNAGAAIFRAMGNSNIAMKTSLLMNSINVFGNALLIFGFHRGVEGVAIPTVVSRGVACVVILILLNNQKHELHILHPYPFKIKWNVLKKILYIGIPNGLENSMFQLGKIAVLSLVSGLGTASLAANAVGNNIANFAILPGMSFGFALLTVCAQCVGAGDFEQVKYYTKHMMRVEYLCLIASNLIVILALPFILSVYNLSDEAAQYANDIILYHAACVVTIWPLSFTLPNTLRAAADVKVTMVLSIISMWVFRFGFSYLLTMVFHMGIFGVWVAMTIDWLVRGIFFVCRYRSGRWQKIIFS